MRARYRPAYDELIAELITLRAALDARRFSGIARAADETIDAALYGAEEVKSETKNDGRPGAALGPANASG